MAVIGTNSATELDKRALAGDDLSGDDYMALVQSKNVEAKVAAAGRQDAPMGALIAFSQDRKVEVRVAVAKNVGIARSTTLGAALVADRAVEVALALVENPAIDDSLIGQIATEGHKGARAAATERLAS